MMDELVEINYNIVYCSVQGINLLTFGEDMSNRESWEFTFTGAELLQAVKDQLTELKGSLTVVKKALADAQKAVSKAGFSFEDGNAIGKGDYKLVNAVHSLRGQLDSKERRQKDLHRWKELLGKGDSMPDLFQLKFGDHAFFFPESVSEPVIKKVPTKKPKTAAKAKSAAKPTAVKAETKKDPFVETAKKIEPTKPKIVETVHVAKT